MELIVGRTYWLLSIGWVKLEALNSPALAIVRSKDHSVTQYTVARELLFENPPNPQ